MTTREKKKFIRDLCERIHAELQVKVPLMPAEWDGHELRKYIAHHFAAADMSTLMTGKRLRDYRNELIVRNL